MDWPSDWGHNWKIVCTACINNSKPCFVGFDELSGPMIRRQREKPEVSQYSTQTQRTCMTHRAAVESDGS